MLINENSKYERQPFADEAEIDKVVIDYAKYLFGSNIIILPKSKIATMGGFETIPDGFVIDVESKEWFMVEAELAAHGTWQHIAPQVSKQVTALSSQSTRDKILKLALNKIKADKASADVFVELKIPQLDIHEILNRIIKKIPTVAIPIDSVPADLKAWVETLKYNVKIWVIEKYVSVDGKTILYSLPEDTMPTISANISEDGRTIINIEKGSLPYQKMFSDRVVKEGQKVFMEYAPRGNEKQTYVGLLRENGVEVDGKIMSLSTAAVYCMRKAGSKRETANGWLMWKTEEGVDFDELYNRNIQTKPKTD